jgi:photosystem II stability/assembly factor-like uncharacterized protein
MAENLGTGVSYVSDVEGYAYDTVVFQKGKPPLDTELNLIQDIRRELSGRQLNTLPSGWITLKPFKTSPLLQNQFYTQDPSTAIPEFALVNGMPIYVTNTGSQQDNVNIIDLGAPPTTGNAVNGVYLEVWRALLNSSSDNNRPQSTTVIDSLSDIDGVDSNHVWAVGENGLVLVTSNGGSTWNIQAINTKRKLNGVSFINSSIGWVVGENGVIARTSSGGQNWTILATGLTENLNGVFAVSQLLVWVVGGSGTILSSTNGINWVAQRSGVTYDLNAVYFYNNLIGWVVGKNGTILKTTDGGANWRALTSGTVKNLNSIFFYDTNFGFAVGDAGTLLRSSDGGATWVSQSGNITDGTNPITVTVDYTDVTMTPSLDEYVNGEDVTSQFTGSSKNFTTMNVPITKGDGHGTITTNPGDVIVKVNDVAVGVDSVNGTTGQIILSAAPRHCDHVKVYYWYKINSAIFRGVAFVTGKTGTVLRTADIGQTWIKQNPNTSYDLNGVNFVDNNVGWVAGQFSIVRHTVDSGTTWVAQTSDVLIRKIQRVFNEGNIGTALYLVDNMIHPDANIETSERVQIQYRIRVAQNVDPFNFPDAGLGSQVIVGLGPNLTGSFAFQNMGATTGDYGLYQAQCPNTVDGYCWAIPIAFVNRRNTTAYSASNTNGTTTSTAIRPDLLTASNVVDADILDVRRKIIIPSITELLDTNFEKLMNNSLRTRFGRNTVGGDRYGTELLQLDRIGGAAGDAGTSLGNLTISTFSTANNQLSSTVTVTPNPRSQDAPLTNPPPISMTLINPFGNGLYHQDLSHYSAFYTGSGNLNGKSIPGYFTGMGTSTVTFYFSADAATKAIGDTSLAYNISADWIKTDNISLTKIPSAPQLVNNYSTSSSFYFRGIFDTDTSGRVIEEWDSGLPDHPNYVIAFPGSEATTALTTRASTIELHYFMKITSSDVDPGDPFKLMIDPNKFAPNTPPYQIRNITKINNLDSGFSYKLSNVIIHPLTGTLITIESITGFPFIVGTTIEIIAMIIGQQINTVRNGSTVNFIPTQKGLENFCESVVLAPDALPSSFTSLDFTFSNGDIIGISVAETVSGLTQQVAWVNETGLGEKMYPVVVTRLTGLNHIHVVFPKSFQGTGTTVAIQVSTKLSTLPNSGANDGILIGYDYTPFQSIAELSTNLTVEMATKPSTVYVADLGTGGSLLTRDPYDNPLINIPVNDTLITDDNSFYNIELLRFSNFSVDGGFVQLQAYVPGNFGNDLTFSGITKDNLQRSFYNVCSKNFSFVTEGLLINAPRKIFISTIGRVKSASDNKFVKGEYVLVIVSRTAFMETLENYTGFEADDKSVIAIYHLPNKPISRT